MDGRVKPGHDGFENVAEERKRELGVCDRKYRNKSGTMYISFTAFCRAEVAQRYSQQMRKAAKAK